MKMPVRAPGAVDKKRWRYSTADKKSMVKLVECHRKIRGRETGFPVRDDLSFGAIDDGDVAHGRQVGKNASAMLL